MRKKIIAMVTLCLSSTNYGFFGHPFMLYRPQGINGARTYADWINSLQECESGNVNLAVEYTRSFNPQSLNCYYFGGNNLTISGSRVENRGANDIMADYFGLPSDFQSTLSFCPQIKNIVVDFDWYWNLHGLCDGLYLHVDMPLVHSSWNIGASEKIINAGNANYPAGYLSSTLLTPDDLPKSALQTLSGNAIFGGIHTPLRYGKIAGKQTDTKLADIWVELGYAAINNECAFLSFDVNTTIPTGTRSQGCTLFEPQIGNGRHWALGGGFTGYYQFWNNECQDLRVTGFVEGQVQHLFASRQRRSFNFKNNGPGNRYMLIQMQLVDGIARTLTVGAPPLGEPIISEYIGILDFGINKTTLDTRVAIDVQADIVAKLTLQWCNWRADIGYNFWARSQEKLVQRACFPNNMYALKGDAQLYGFLQISPELVIPIPGNATQHAATIHAGQGNGNTTDNFVNNNADNAEPLFNVGIPLQQTNPLDDTSNTGIISIAQVNGSDQAILLSDADIDNCSALSPRAYSNKIFGYIGFTGHDAACVIPHLGIGAEAEFAGKVCGIKTAVSQWGVWIKGGVCY